MTSNGTFSVRVVENHFWQNLCHRLGKPEYGPLQYDETRREERIALIGEKIRKGEHQKKIGPAVR